MIASARSGAAALIAVGLLTQSAHAGRTPPPAVRGDLELLTDVPMQVGGRFGLELPERVRVGLTLGVLPEGYVQLIDAILVGAGAFDAQTGDLIEAALRSSLVVRARVGWHPVADEGFYFDVGYTLATLGGGIGGQTLIAAVTGRDAPEADGLGRLEYDVASTLHMLDLEIGWRFALDERWSLRVALGFAGTVASSTTVAPTYRPLRPEEVAAFTASAEAYLDDIYTGYVHAPTVSVALGYRLF